MLIVLVDLSLEIGGGILDHIQVRLVLDATTLLCTHMQVMSQTFRV